MTKKEFCNLQIGDLIQDAADTALVSGFDIDICHPKSNLHRFVRITYLETFNSQDILLEEHVLFREICHYKLVPK